MVRVTINNSGASTKSVHYVTANGQNPIWSGDSAQVNVPDGGLIAIYPIPMDEDRIYTPSEFTVTSSQGIYNVTQHWTNDNFTNAFSYLLLKANTSGTINVAYYGD